MAKIPTRLPPRPEPAPVFTAPLEPAPTFTPLRPSRPAETRAPVSHFQKPASEPFPERRFGGFEPAPDDMVALRLPIGQNEEAIRRIAQPESEGMAGPAFREGNWLVSLLAQDTTMYKPEPKYTPLQDIADTRFLTDYSDEFVGARSRAETRSIMAKIERREHDEEILRSGGWLGIVAGFGAGLIDPLNLVPGGAVFKGGKVAATVKSAVSGGRNFGAVAAVQQGLLSLSHPEQTLEESIFNIGAATLVGGLLDAAGEVDRGPLANAAAALVDQGLISDAVALLDGNAASRRDELLQAAKIVPAGLSVIPIGGTCLAPRLTEGDIAAIDPFGYVEPGQFANFKSKSEAFHLAKVFIGVTNSDAVKSVFKLDFPGPVAIFWMANPEAHIFFALDDLEYLARIDGRVDDGWYSELGSWPLETEQLLASFGDHIQRRPLACFGCPPLALGVTHQASPPAFQSCIHSQARFPGGPDRTTGS